MEHYFAMNDFSFQTVFHANFSVNCNCINFKFLLEAPKKNLCKVVFHIQELPRIV